MAVSLQLGKRTNSRGLAFGDGSKWSVNPKMEMVAACLRTNPQIVMSVTRLQSKRGKLAQTTGSSKSKVVESF
jgi:hypothetical protein